MSLTSHTIVVSMVSSAKQMPEPSLQLHHDQTLSTWSLIRNLPVPRRRRRRFAVTSRRSTQLLFSGYRVYFPKVKCSWTITPSVRSIRMSGDKLPLSHTPSKRVQDKFCLCDLRISSSALLRGVRWFKNEVSELSVPSSKVTQSKKTAWPLKMGPIRSPETSGSKHLTQRNNSKDGRIQISYKFMPRLNWTKEQRQHWKRAKKGNLRLPTAISRPTLC
jgi:hypothetical protein